MLRAGPPPDSSLGVPTTGRPPLVPTGANPPALAPHHPLTVHAQREWDDYRAKGGDWPTFVRRWREGLRGVISRATDSFPVTPGESAPLNRRVPAKYSDPEYLADISGGGVSSRVAAAEGEAHALHVLQRSMKREEGLIKHHHRLAKSSKVMLSACTVKYLDAITNPFVPHAACFPLPPCIPSAPLSVFSRGTFGAGTTTTAFVLVDPKTSFDGSGSWLYHSNTSFNASAFATSGTGVVGVTSNSPYTLSSKISIRCYAAGLRVRYIGKEVDREGRYIGWTQANHNSLVGKTSSDLLSQDVVSTQAMDRKWHYVVWSPQLPSEYNYEEASNFTNTPCMGFIVNGVPAAVTEWEYEAWAHFEVIGEDARGAGKRMSDPIGGNAAVEWASSLGGMAQTAKEWAPTIKAAYDATSAIVSAFSGPSGAVASGGGQAALRTAYNAARLTL